MADGGFFSRSVDTLAKQQKPGNSIPHSGFGTSVRSHLTSSAATPQCLLHSLLGRRGGTMTRWLKDERIGNWCWVIACGLLSSYGCLLTAREIGATFDEPLYVARGIECWRTGSHRGLIKLGTMPLPIDVQTLPLYLAERWTGIAWDAKADLARLLPWARAGTLLFWWLLLIYAFLAGRELAGVWAGRLAVALLACEPSLLAHASLATTDIAVSACLLALVYHFRTGRDANWFWRIVVPAFWFATAVLSKASGLVFGPLCLAVVELERLTRNGSLSWKFWQARFGLARGQTTLLDASWAWLQQAWRMTRPLRWDALGIVGLGTVLFVVYCGTDWQAEPSFVAWARKQPDGPAKASLLGFAENLRIFSNAGEGLVRQIRHNVRGHGAFLLGEWSPRAFWYYFPVALTIKLSVPLLLTVVLATLCGWRALVNWAFLCALALLVFSFSCRVQIGIRLVLPLVVLAIVGLAAALTTIMREERRAWRQVALPCVVAFTLGWSALAAQASRPLWLPYTNELWGGTPNGYHLLSDSNYDWGQGLKELAAWCAAQDVETINVWYFGADPAVNQPPLQELPLHTKALERPEDVAPLVRGRLLAVSTTLLYGNPNATAAQVAALRWLQERQPIGRTTTYFIFDCRAE